MDYLAAETSITEYLKDALPDVAVDTVLSASEVLTKSRAKPTVLVIFDGDSLLDTLGNGATLVAQRWAVFLIARGPKATRESGNAATGTPSDGVILAQLLEALAGFVPGDGYTPLVRATGIQSDYRDGARIYGAAFSTQVVIGG